MVISVKWTKGDDYDANEDDIFTAGIHVDTTGNDKSECWAGFWGNRIEVYGNTKKEAQKLRDAILTVLRYEEIN